MSADVTRREGRHRDECFAEQAVVDGRWPHPWSGIEDAPVYRAVDGTVRGGGYRWRVIACNDPDCRATLLVRDAWLVEQAAAEHRRHRGGVA